MQHKHYWSEWNISDRFKTTDVDGSKKMIIYERRVCLTCHNSELKSKVIV